MKKIIVTILASLMFIPLALLAQSEKRKVESFHAISMGVPGDLYITQGNQLSLEVKGDPDDLEDLVTEVRNQTLVIKYDRSGWNFGRDRVTIYVTTPEISEISLGGSGKVISENVLQSDELELDVSGSGKMELQVEADKIDASISGSGNITFSGEADEVQLTISGSGNLDGEDLMADRYHVRISGSGRSRIYVGDELEAEISGSGSVYYKGDPDRVISNVSGSGRVRKL